MGRIVQYHVTGVNKKNAQPVSLADSGGLTGIIGIDTAHHREFLAKRTCGMSQIEAADACLHFDYGTCLGTGISNRLPAQPLLIITALLWEIDFGVETANAQ